MRDELGIREERVRHLSLTLYQIFVARLERISVSHLLIKFNSDAVDVVRISGAGPFGSFLRSLGFVTEEEREDGERTCYLPIDDRVLSFCQTHLSSLSTREDADLLATVRMDLSVVFASMGESYLMIYDEYPGRTRRDVLEDMRSAVDRALSGEFDARARLKLLAGAMVLNGSA